MIEVGVGEQHIIDILGIEAERLGILFLELPTTLIQAAIDQDLFARAFDQMAGACHAPIGAVKR
jgi:hypothetical protein